MKLIRKMTREEMWEEFESQLKCEVRTPITMSYEESIRLAEMGIKDVVARWKERLEEQELCDDAISRQAVLNKAFEIKTGENTSAMVVYAEDIRKESPVMSITAENKEEIFITNGEKFHEVFGYEIDDSYPADLCDMINNAFCIGQKDCAECPLNNFWNKLYKKPKTESED